MNHEKKIRSFTDLDAWREAHRLTIAVYIATKQYPKDEQFGLTSQTRRATVSMESNIAEGFSRPTFADKAHFYSMALGSNTELQTQLLIARDLGYIDKASFQELATLSITVNKLINGLIKKTKSFS